MECPVLSVLFYPLIFFHRQYFLVYFLKLCWRFFFFFVLPFSFCLYMFQRLSFVLSFWSVFVDLYLRFQSNFSSWFCFIVVLFEGSQFSHKLISPVHRLVHLIQLYYSLIYKLVIDLFFSVSVLTVLNSMFISDGKVVFSPFMILFKFSRFTFCSCVSVISVLFGCMLFGCEAFGCVACLVSKVGCSFWLDCFVFFCFFFC